ncbi:MAG: hypothetical protein EU541_08130 [Promethearchaeota archaeon]|nr:MAG: hypothetical protein EU541_08130 [Candidatus Lokiarchaeota archaeon]
MENKLLKTFQSIKESWQQEQIIDSYDPLGPRASFELAYHTKNSLQNRCIWLQLKQDFNPGSKAILYSKDKTFSKIETLDDNIEVINYFNNESKLNTLKDIYLPLLQERKTKFNEKEKELKTQLLKTILVERKIDECANLVMTKDINRKVYFAIGDARESAAVVPMFMEAEGASLVQLALNKWMSSAQQLSPEEPFPKEKVPGLLKNLLQIKRWTLNLISKNLDK